MTPWNLEIHKIIQINRSKNWLAASITALQESTTVNNKRYYGEESNWHSQKGEIGKAMNLEGKISRKGYEAHLETVGFGWIFLLETWLCKQPTKAQTPRNSDLIPCIQGDFISILHIQLRPLSSNRKTKMQSSSTSHLV